MTGRRCVINSAAFAGMDETEEGPLSERSWSVARTTENTVLRPRCTFTVPMSLPSVSVVRPSLGCDGGPLRVTSARH